MDKLIKELEDFRLENKITQQQLAKLLEVSFPTINRWFNGRTKPRPIQRYHIEKFLAQKGKQVKA